MSSLHRCCHPTALHTGLHIMTPISSRSSARGLLHSNTEFPKRRPSSILSDRRPENPCMTIKRLGDSTWKMNIIALSLCPPFAL